MPDNAWKGSFFASVVEKIHSQKCCCQKSANYNMNTFNLESANSTSVHLSVHESCAEKIKSASVKAAGIRH